MIERYYYDDIDSTEKNEKDSGFDLFKYKYPFDFSKEVVKKDKKPAVLDDKEVAVVPEKSDASAKEIDMGGNDDGGGNANDKKPELNKKAKRQSVYEQRVAQAERLLSRLEQS